MAKVNQGAVIGAPSGRIGNVVFFRNGTGVAMREFQKPRDPRTPAQLAARDRMALAAAAWRSLSATQVQAWKRTCGGSPSKARATFIRLALKFLQVTPGGTIPLDPPLQAFAGDAISVTVHAVPSPSPGLNGSLIFAADAPNGPHAVCELLVQPLSYAGRTPQVRDYRTSGFFRFVANGLSTSILKPAGAYATAVRFVNPSTGQSSGVIELEIVSIT